MHFIFLESKIKEFPLLLYFEKQTRCCSSSSTFSPEDLFEYSKFSKKLQSALTKTLKEKYGVDHGKEYNLVGVTKLALAQSVNRSTDAIKFHIKIDYTDNFQAQILTRISHEYEELAIRLAENIQKEVKSYFKTKVRVHVTQMYLRSLNILGTLSSKKPLKFTEEEKAIIVQLMENLTREIFRRQNVRAGLYTDQSQDFNKTAAPIGEPEAHIKLQLAITNPEFASKV